MIYAAQKIKGLTNYEAALAAARVRLAGADVAGQARRLGGSVQEQEDGTRTVRFFFMGAAHHIRLPEGTVSRGDGAPVGVFSEILILHLLLSHTGRPPAGRWIAFADIPDGLLYAGVYDKRTSRRLARALSGADDLLAAAAGRLGGKEAALGGDTSVVVEPFVGVPVGIVFWRGDDDFSPAVTFLYDRTITGILPAEDIVVLTQCLTEEIITILGEMSG
jgi:hypothetical protein